MRAITINEPDGPNAITVEDRPVRDPGAGEVRLRVTAAAVNPADIFMWRSLGGGAVEPPFTPGLDAAGVVEAVGEGVERLGVGDPVIAVVNARLADGGAQAELVVVPAASVVPQPAGTTPEEAATLPMNGLTALMGLAMLDLDADSSLALSGGAGQLASFAIPLAKRQGLTVIADAKAEDEALVTGFGADHLVPRGVGFVPEVRDLAPGGVDGLFDAAGLTHGVLDAVRDGGDIAVVRGWEGPEPGRGIAVHAVSVGATMQNTGWLQLLADEATAGRLQLRVAETFPPERILDAYRLMESGGLRGRAVIVFD